MKNSPHTSYKKAPSICQQKSTNHLWKPIKYAYDYRSFWNLLDDNQNNIFQELVRASVGEIIRSDDINFFIEDDTIFNKKN